MTRETGGRKQSSMSPCAACKLLRRRCASDCVFAPYFPADDPQKFANVHRVFGASNVNKMLQDLPLQNRADAVSSMVYEANARVRDPVYGCVGAISSLQHQVYHLQKELAIAHAEVVHLRLRATAAAAAQVSPTQPQKSAPVAPGAASDKSSAVSAGGAAHKSDSSCEDDRLWNPPCVLDLAASCFH